MATLFAPSSFRLRAVVTSACLAIFAGLAATPAEAIPAFARKYRTSCQTCHIAVPKLNPFGEAFRLLGYRMPAETEDTVKEAPVPLGAPAYKRLWPKAVWPSDIPGTVPLSVNMSFADVSNSTLKNDLRFPEEIALLSGGTLGDRLSFFGEVVFEQTVADGETGVEVALEHAQLNFNGPFGTGTKLNLRVGRFAPEIATPLGHLHMLPDGGPASFLDYVPVAAQGGAGVEGEGGGLALPESVDGLEVYGILAHRFLYSAGLSNGIGPGVESMDANSAKDVFGRVAYKIGGLAYDGSNYVESDKNWRERSLALGLFAYRGNGSNIFIPGDDPETVVEDTSYTRVGADVNAYAGDLNIVAGVVRGRDTLSSYLAADETEAEARIPETHGDFTYRAWFVEGDYVFLPWLDGGVRYEWLRPAREGEPNFRRIVPNITALVRANVKAYVEYQRDLGHSDSYELATGLRFLF